MAVNNVGQLQQLNPTLGNDRLNKDSIKGGPSFKEHLDATLPGVGKEQAAIAPKTVKFSGHAVDRMRTRGITYTPKEISQIESAVTKAAQKGSKETLVVTDNSALVVNIKNSTVVTVMDKNNMKENVFTNIDSTVMI